MLEGKELVQKLGQYGEASLDVTPDGKLKIAIEAHYEVDLIAEIKKLAEKTSTPLDDKAIEYVEKLLKAKAALG